MDATVMPFPRKEYDVIIWDGAIGHFAPEAMQKMLQKISRALKHDGVFVGSESLGQEGHDHLQYFETVEDLATLLRSEFAHVEIKALRYTINDGTLLRHEAYWRCSNSVERLDAARWQIFSKTMEDSYTRPHFVRG